MEHAGPSTAMVHHAVLISTGEHVLVVAVRLRHRVVGAFRILHPIVVVRCVLPMYLDPQTACLMPDRKNIEVAQVVPVL